MIDKCLYHPSERNLTTSNFLLGAWLKLHGFGPVSFTMPYSKLYILAELSPHDVKFISVDRQKLVLSKYITYGTVNLIFVEIQPDSTNIKNDPRILGQLHFRFQNTYVRKTNSMKTAISSQLEIIYCLAVQIF